MGNSLKTHKFEEIKEQLEKATDWVIGLELEYKTTRIGKYKKDIELVVASLKENRIDKLTTDEAFPQVMNSLYEIDEFIQIYKTLHSVNNLNFLKPKLKYVLGGPPSLSSENEGT